MADGALIIDLDDATAARLAAAAAAAGESPAAFASQVLAEALDPDHWAIAIERLEEYDRTGSDDLMTFCSTRPPQAARRAATLLANDIGSLAEIAWTSRPRGGAPVDARAQGR